MPSRLSLPLVVLTLALGLTLVGCQGAAKSSAAGKAQPVQILRTQTGSDAGFQAPQVLLINSAEELSATGSQELSKLSPSFETESIIVLTLGQQKSGGYWAQILGVQVQGNQIFVQGIANRPADEEATTQALTYPYAAVVIPKLHGEIRSEIESVVGHPAPEAAPQTAPAAQ